jgi:hypothetical protein
MRIRTLAFALIASVCASCATDLVVETAAMDFFVSAPDSNPWREKIADWQQRHEDDPTRSAAPDARATKLGDAYVDFTHSLRMRVAQDAVTWVQSLSRDHYRPDGEHDHWATLGEVIETDGDDCDGLDLLTFVLLRRLGFDEREIYRAIVVERGTGQHHMVTLWFDTEAERNDPWILDPTGVVAAGLARLSHVPKWEPIELFDERAHFAVTEIGDRTTAVTAAD